MRRIIAVALVAMALVAAPVRAEYGLMNLPVWCEAYPGVTEILDQDHQERVYGNGVRAADTWWSCMSRQHRYVDARPDRPSAATPMRFPQW